MIGSPLSAFKLLIVNKILSRIQKCIETEAHRVLGNDVWKISLSCGHLLHCCAFVEYMTVEILTLRVFGMNSGAFCLFSQTMSRNGFREILRFLGFYLRSIRSVRLQTDKLALVSGIWNGFVSSGLLQTRCQHYRR